MSDIFISYARSTEAEARQIGGALRALGYAVWRDDELPAHRAYSDVIEERLKAAKAVVVIWSAEAVKSQWVRSEADRAREDGKLVQVNVEAVRLPMPFDQIQCADLSAWRGDAANPGWLKALESVAALAGGAGAPTPAARPAATASPVAAPAKASVAVLPFANLSPDPEQDYFAQGMAEEIATALTHSPSLFVVRAAAAPRREGRFPAEIARALGVRYLLDGSVRKAGERVRITVALADAIDNLPIWSDRFDGALTDIFALQDEVAAAAATKIAPNIGVAELRRATSRPTEDLTAYDLYLRGSQCMRRNEVGDLRQGLAFLEQAIARDPNYAAALALAALAHSLLVWFGEADLPASRPVALDYAARAFRGQHDDPESVAYLAMAESNFGADTTVAIRVLDRTRERFPSVAVLWHASAFLALSGGRPDLAEQRFAEAMRLDPCEVDLPFNQAGLGAALVQQGRFADAVEPLAESLRLAPGNLAAAMTLAFALTHLERTDRAREVLARYRWAAIAAFLSGLEGRFEHAPMVAMLRQLDFDV